MASEHHLFLSYARADNLAVPPAKVGWVAAFKARLEQQHCSFSGQPLRIFYDANCIREGDDWETRIGQALRSSQLLLAFLSPAFLQSEWCRREWEEYLRHEHNLSRSEGGIVPVYFAYAPELDPKAQVELEAQFHDWVADINRVQRSAVIDIRPWYEGGAQALEVIAGEERLEGLAAAPRTDAALQPQDFIDQLAQLDRAIAERLDRALLAEQAQKGGFLTASYDHFVGRGQQLRDLHKMLSAGKTSLIAALHGLGGQGKSALAVQYAYAYGGYYACGGRWLVGCEGKASLLQVFETLAALIGRPLSDADNQLADQDKLALYHARFEAHCMDGKARIVDLLGQQGGDWFTPAGQRELNIAPRMLVILDNVDQAELLSASQLGSFPKSDWLDFVVTSRMGPHDLGLDEDAAIEIGDLPEGDALALLRSRHPFATPHEEAAARDLVRMLWGHVLSVDLVGAHVAVQAAAGYSYAAMRDALAAHGVGALDDQVLGKARSATRAAMTAKTIGAVMDQTWAQLTAPQQRVLEYASLCPPDLVPTAWLRMVLEQEFAELARPEGPSLSADPWDTLLLTLHDRRLLTQNRVADGAEPSASIHRLVADTVMARMGAEVEAARRERLIQLADFWGAIMEQRGRQHPALAGRWLKLLTALTTVLMDSAKPDQRLTSNIGVCSDFAMQFGGIAAAQTLLEQCYNAAEAMVADNPDDTLARRDLSISQNNLGDFYMRRRAPGDSERALAAYQAALAIREALVDADPDNALARRDLSVTQINLGNFYLRRGAPGDPERALAAFQAALARAEAMVGDNPDDAQARRDLSVSQNRLGDFYLRRRAPGDAERALVAYQAALETAEALVGANPDDAQARRDLSVAQGRLGDFYLHRGALGDAERALVAYQAALATDEALVADNPEDAQARRDLSVAQERLGDFYLRRGAPGDAERGLAAYQAALATREALVVANPDDALARRDLSVSHSKLADFYLRRSAPGDPERALAAYQAALATDEALVADNSEDAQARRDLSVAQERLGEFYLGRAGPGDALRTVDYFGAAAGARRELVKFNPGIGELLAELTVSLFRLCLVFAQLQREEDLHSTVEELQAIVQQWDARGFEPDNRVERVRDILRQTGLMEDNA